MRDCRPLPGASMLPTMAPCGRRSLMIVAVACCLSSLACSGGVDPGSFVGDMTGAMSGRSFGAYLRVVLGEEDNIDGTWLGRDDFSTWEGRVRGALDATANLTCDSYVTSALCVELTKPGGLATVGVLEGDLADGQGSGTWSFQASDTEYNGSGTWIVRRLVFL